MKTLVIDPIWNTLSGVDRLLGSDVEDAGRGGGHRAAVRDRDRCADDPVLLGQLLQALLPVLRGVAHELLPLRRRRPGTRPASRRSLVSRLPGAAPARSAPPSARPARPPGVRRRIVSASAGKRIRTGSDPASPVTAGNPSRSSSTRVAPSLAGCGASPSAAWQAPVGEQLPAHEQPIGVVTGVDAVVHRPRRSRRGTPRPSRPSLVRLNQALRRISGSKVQVTVSMPRSERPGPLVQLHRPAHLPALSRRAAPRRCASAT